MDYREQTFNKSKHGAHVEYVNHRRRNSVNASRIIAYVDVSYNLYNLRNKNRLSHVYEFMIIFIEWETEEFDKKSVLRQIGTDDYKERSPKNQTKGDKHQNNYLHFVLA